MKFEPFSHRILIHVAQQRQEQPNTSNENLSKTCREHALKFIIGLYISNQYSAAARDVSLLPRENLSLWNFLCSKVWRIPHNLESLNGNYFEEIGSYINSFFFNETILHRFKRDLRQFFKFNSSLETPTEKSDKYSTEEMVRDLFLWSVYMGYDDIAFVLLLQMKLRIGAALLAAGITKRASLLTNKLDVRHMFKEQSSAYESYATACIEACYKHNEECAWKMLLVPRPFYGDATYMQVSR